MVNAMIISELAMFALVSELAKGATFISIKTVTVPDMRKTGNPFVGNVKKHSVVNGILGFDYEDGVNRIAAKEGKEQRESKPRAWGVISPCKRFVFHKGKVYLRLRCQAVMETPLYFDNDGLIVGERLDQLKSFFPVKVKSSTQADLQGEVIERDYGMETIIAFTFNKANYIVDHSTPATAPEMIVPVETTPAKVFNPMTV